MYSYFSAILQVAFSLCSSRKYGISIPGELVIPHPPPPGISVIFQLGWVPSGKKICAKKVVALYVYTKDNFFCDEMSKNVFIMNSRTFLANN